MKRIFLSPTVAWIFCGALCAQAPRAPESLSAWPYFKEIQVPPGRTGLQDFVLDREVLDRARADHADVRLYNGAVEIPYVLRIRRDVETAEPFSAREFNRSTEAGVAQASYDLGESPQEHNEVEIQTSGDNYRRLADVQGSPDGTQWFTLISGAILFRFTAGGRTVEQLSITYPTSRYRYLRIRMNRDPQVDRAAPELSGVRIRHVVHKRGELVTYQGSLAGRDPDRVNSRAASIYRVDLLGRVPIDRLMVTTAADGAFSRPFQLDQVDDPAAPALLASGDLVRHEGGPPEAAIDFSQRFARRLKLTVTDDRNVPLSILNIVAQGAARQVIFEAESAGAGPVRVYYGNPRATAPRYDLAARLPEDFNRAPMRLLLSEQHENPVYSPEPKPFSERSPWLVYLVLGAACAVLAVILLSLVRQSATASAEA